MTYKKIALTISPMPRWGSDIYFYHSDRTIIRKALNKCSDRYFLYPEFDNKDRLHYHGIVFIKDPIKWYKRVKKELYMRLGYICTKPIKTHKAHIGWLVYSSKDWGYNSQIFEEPIFPHSVKRRKALEKLWKSAEGRRNGKVTK